MHWWKVPFSSSSQSAVTGSEKTAFVSSRAKLTENDVEEWRSGSYTVFHHSSSALAQPLPLPREPKLVPSTSHNVPLPSPCGRSQSGEQRVINQLNRLAGKHTRKSMEQSESRLSRNLALKQYASESSSNVTTPTPKSAPTSRYSSPVSSPLHSDVHMTPSGIFHSTGNTGLSSKYQIPSDKTALLCDVKVKGLPGPILALPSKISLETPNAQADVHILPLPPGIDMPSLPTPISHLSGATMFLPITPTYELPGVKKASPLSQVVNKPEPMLIRSQWQKGKLIGRGTFGSVYVASNRETGALCALKEVQILPGDKKSQESMRQLQQEIKVLSNLKHPNIVQYYGSEIVGNKFYIYLEYVHPGSINKFIHDHCTAISESVVRNFTRHILCGLAYLHSRKTIHRDIKGANLLVDAHGVVKLADFGMAKHLTGEAANLSLKGSPYWLAPELLQSVMSKDASVDLALAVDIWSLGCTIIEMIEGKPPWSDCEGAAALFKVLKESPPIPETLSADGKDFLKCCFHRNPADRPTAMKLLEHPFVNSSVTQREGDLHDSEGNHATPQSSAMS